LIGMPSHQHEKKQRPHILGTVAIICRSAPPWPRHEHTEQFGSQWILLSNSESPSPPTEQEDTARQRVLSCRHLAYGLALEGSRIEAAGFHHAHRRRGGRVAALRARAGSTDPPLDRAAVAVGTRQSDTQRRRVSQGATGFWIVRRAECCVGAPVR